MSYEERLNVGYRYFETAQKEAFSYYSVEEQNWLNNQGAFFVEVGRNVQKIELAETINITF